MADLKKKYLRKDLSIILIGSLMEYIFLDPMAVKTLQEACLKYSKIVVYIIPMKWFKTDSELLTRETNIGGS